MKDLSSIRRSTLPSCYASTVNLGKPKSRPRARQVIYFKRFFCVFFFSPEMSLSEGFQVGKPICTPLATSFPPVLTGNGEPWRRIESFNGTKMPDTNKVLLSRLVLIAQHYGQIQPPLFHVGVDHILPCTLHCLLRISDKLEGGAFFHSSFQCLTELKASFRTF